MQLLDERVQRRTRTLGDYFHATSIWQVADMTAQIETSTHAGDEEAEADALDAAADGGLEASGTCGFGFHVRGARPVRALHGAGRGSGVRRPGV